MSDSSKKKKINATSAFEPLQKIKTNSRALLCQRSLHARAARVSMFHLLLIVPLNTDKCQTPCWTLARESSHLDTRIILCLKL